MTYKSTLGFILSFSFAILKPFSNAPRGYTPFNGPLYYNEREHHANAYRDRDHHAPLPLNWKDPNSRSFCYGTESRGVVHEAVKGTAFSKIFEWPMKRSQVDLHNQRQRSHWNRRKADLENEIGRKAVNISNYVPLVLTILFRGGRRESEFRQVNFMFLQI
ncbi:unnamed protein product [Citrullus colocynthis]|uniref:Uncharacterized protein n=1 Tax=Citrullus colocynthis TaxID=252529 RepID=A0ABP0Y9M5_9ROSI